MHTEKDIIGTLGITATLTILVQSPICIMTFEDGYTQVCLHEHNHIEITDKQTLYNVRAT